MQSMTDDGLEAHSLVRYVALLLGTYNLSHCLLRYRSVVEFVVVLL
jgi:hypothetical protein